MKPIQRFIEHIRKDERGCWIWESKQGPDGYGHFYSGQFFTAHRWSYEHFNGPIGEFLVCHRCDVKSCVNPSHLFLGTAQDNTDDAVKKGRVKRKLTEDQVREIRELRQAGVPRKRVADRFGVGMGTIEDIDKFLTWKWVK